MAVCHSRYIQLAVLMTSFVLGCSRKDPSVPKSNVVVPSGSRYVTDPSSVSDKHGVIVFVHGVVGDAKYLSLREEMPPTAYLYALQGEELGDFFFEVRAASNPTALVPQIRTLLRTVDSRLTPWNPKTLAEQVDQSLYQEKLVSTLSSFFRVLALVLACIGLYGIMAYAVARRTNEIGIRMALGAQRSRILQMVLREALLLAAICVVIGLPCAPKIKRVPSSIMKARPNVSSRL